MERKRTWPERRLARYCVRRNAALVQTDENAETLRVIMVALLDLNWKSDQILAFLKGDDGWEEEEADG